MKTFFSFAYRGNAIARFGCSIMSIASLTFVVFPAQAKQPQQRVHIGIQSTIIASCSADCDTKLHQCLMAKTDRNICYRNYNICTSRCGGFNRYSYLKPEWFLPKQS
jgi:hypothetical protein